MTTRSSALAEKLTDAVEARVSLRDEFEPYIEIVGAVRLIETAFAEVAAEARRKALGEAARVASRFSMGPEARLHPDIPWAQMDETAQTAAHSSAQQIAMLIGDLIDTPETPDPKFQDGVRDWLLVCFGEQIASDKVEQRLYKSFGMPGPRAVKASDTRVTPPREEPSSADFPPWSREMAELIKELAGEVVELALRRGSNGTAAHLRCFRRAAFPPEPKS